MSFEITGQIFPVDTWVPLCNTFVRGEPLNSDYKIWRQEIRNVVLLSYILNRLAPWVPDGIPIGLRQQTTSFQSLTRIDRRLNMNCLRLTYYIKLGHPNSLDAVNTQAIWNS